MKQTLIIIVLTGIAFLSSAQTQFGLKAGLNLSTFNYEIREHSASHDLELDGEYSSLPGFQGGFIFMAPFNGENFGIRAEFMFSNRNVEFNYNRIETDFGKQVNKEVAVVSQNKTAYLEIPLNLYAGIPIGLSEFQLFAGLTTAVGLFGTETYSIWRNQTDLKTGITTTKEFYKGKVDIAFGRYPSDPAERSSNTQYRNPFDFSVNIGASYLLNQRLLVSVQYSVGLSNTYAFREEYLVYNRKNENRLKYRNTILSIGYMF